MNDEFLYRLRKDPPLSYALRLKAKLRQQEAPAAAPVRRRPMLRTFLAVFLVGGSALAATLFAVKGPATFVEMFRPEVAAPSAAPPTPERLQPKSAARSRGTSDVPTNSFVTSAPGQGGTVSAAGVSGADATGANEAARTGSPAGPTMSSTRDSQPHGGLPGAAARGSVGILVTTSAYEVARSVTRRTSIALYASPFIEKTDNSIALKALCDLTGPERADVAITSRPMTDTERALCRQNGLRDVVEAKFGYRAIVVTRAKTGIATKLSPRELFLATARRVPAPGNSRMLIDNPYTHWDQINPALDPGPIQVWGPARESPAWAPFAEFILETGCDSHPWIAALKEVDREQYDDICHTLRLDGGYSEVLQNHLLVEQRIWGEPNAVVVLDYPFYESNRSSLLSSLLSGAVPTRESILDGTYPGARPLYFVAARNPGVQSSAVTRFRQLFLREFFIGQSSYDDVLIPLDREGQQALRDAMR